MQTNGVRLIPPIATRPQAFVHHADAALRSLHELSVVMVTENPVHWLTAALTTLGAVRRSRPGTLRRELQSIRGRLVRASCVLRRPAAEVHRPVGERIVATAALWVEAIAVLVRTRREERA